MSFSQDTTNLSPTLSPKPDSNVVSLPFEYLFWLTQRFYGRPGTPANPPVFTAKDVVNTTIPVALYHAYCEVAFGGKPSASEQQRLVEERHKELMEAERPEPWKLTSILEAQFERVGGSPTFPRAVPGEAKEVV